MYDTVRTIRCRAVFIPCYVATEKTFRIGIREKLLRISRFVTHRVGPRMGRLVLATRHVLQPPRRP